MIVNGKEWLVDDKLSARWPLYTRGNVGEVFPDVVTPLNWTLLGGVVEDSWREAWREFGIVADGDFDTERVIVCIAGGYCYLNMSYIRLLGVRTPGSSVKAIDKQFLGEVDAPPYIERRGDKNFFCSLKLLWETEKTLRTRRPNVIEDMRQRSSAWVACYPGDDAADEALVDYVFAYPKQHRYLFGRHVLVTFKATVATGTIALLSALKVKDPGLTLDLLSGVEGVESAEPARIMWSLGRMIVASPKLTELFDRGVDAATWPALQATPEAMEFVAIFADFLARYGYRGPNEWELASQPWRMRPEVPLRAIDRLRQSDEHDAPGADLRGAACQQPASRALCAPQARSARSAEVQQGAACRESCGRPRARLRRAPSSERSTAPAAPSTRSVDASPSAIVSPIRAGSTCSTARSWRPMSPIPSRSSRASKSASAPMKRLASAFRPSCLKTRCRRSTLGRSARSMTRRADRRATFSRASAARRAASPASRAS